jgi:signal transduction histidine kinase
VRLTVRDHGGGIPPDSLERVFDRYTRLEREVRDRVPGTGLGLPIARQIVRMHGGRIWAENAPGGGAVLVVELPRWAGAEEVDAGPVL